MNTEALTDDVTINDWTLSIPDEDLIEYLDPDIYDKLLSDLMDGETVANEECPTSLSSFLDGELATLFPDTPPPPLQDPKEKALEISFSPPSPPPFTVVSLVDNMDDFIKGKQKKRNYNTCCPRRSERLAKRRKLT